MSDIDSSGSGSFELSEMDVIDLGEFSWNQRLRPKPKLHGKYLLGDILGQGTFAKVYEVLDLVTLERQAVKIYDLQKIDRKFNRDEMIAMVNQEINLLTGCNHPNVIKLIDVHRRRKNHEELAKKEKEAVNQKSAKENESSNQQQSETRRRLKKSKIWVYMEYCMASVAELMQLANPSQVKKLPRKQARRYFTGLLSGLDYLHSKGIFHKDIKPDNMLINVFDTIKLTDLSVSYVVDIFTQSDICFNTYGTIAYQSPEVINSTDAGFSASALDIWSAGVTLYVMVTGKLPFSSKSGFIAMTESILADNPQADDILKIDPCLSNLIHSMLDKDPVRRIKLYQVLNHPWFLINLMGDSPKINIPPRYANGDQYRSLTITSHLHELHYPLPNDQNIVRVSESSAEEFNAKRKIPIVRSNRSPTRHRKNKRRPSFIEKVTSGQIGRLLGAIGLKADSFNVCDLATRIKSKVDSSTNDSDLSTNQSESEER
ncbi:serine/threonine-protein kinase stk11-like [Tetranychus urticae]|uniref:serine/threonine-protein kinase stk11-like n=1 Tax=Tetranychus urticae TaxID=32264 RepID=UPI00077BCAFB|nr:serine/threonine-protein kinase stk11-like [Tetranychus urticae]